MRFVDSLSACDYAYQPDLHVILACWMVVQKPGRAGEMLHWRHECVMRRQGGDVDVCLQIAANKSGQVEDCFSAFRLV